MLVSELGGSRGLLDKVAELGIDFPLTPRRGARADREASRSSEARGYQYEGADASFEMLVRRSLPGYTAALQPRRLLGRAAPQRQVDRRIDDASEMQAEAMVKVRVFAPAATEDRVIQTAADGNGPVNALDAAVRKALGEYYPGIDDIRLVDYKVRIIDSSRRHRRLRPRPHRVQPTTSTPGRRVGASTDIIEASWLALADAYQWWLLRHPA